MKTLALLSTVLCLAAASPIVYPRQQTCNGKSDLCDRKYSDVTFIGTHDSPFVGSTLELTTNQGVDVTAQLNAGIRFLQGQTHKNGAGDLHFCHTSCLLEDAGSVESYLSKVKKWMDSNPNEVVTILLTNGDNVDVSMFDDAFQGAGLVQYAHKQQSHLKMDQWPTLGEMISSKGRLVVFLDYGADVHQFPYILSEFSHYLFETPFDTTNPDFPQCKFDRPAKGSPDKRMYIVNHFLDKSIFGVEVPDNDADFRTNAATGPGSIGAQADLCTKKYGRKPNFILVDRFDRGDVFKAQNALNSES